MDKSKNRALLGADLDTRTSNGVLVTRVPKGFPAAEGGLLSGDVIVKFDGEEVSAYPELFRLLALMDPGDKVDVVVERRGREVALQITMGDRAKFMDKRR